MCVQGVWTEVMYRTCRPGRKYKLSKLGIDSYHVTLDSYFLYLGIEIYHVKIRQISKLLFGQRVPSIVFLIRLLQLASRKA
jgi:hypothetical protein